MTTTNRGQKNKNDHWLTPQPIIELLGPFDLDPCCPPLMPWRTAKKMLTNGAPTGWEKKLLKHHFVHKMKTVKPVLGNGLEDKWEGEVFLNNPFSLPLPWMEKMAAYARGVVLAPAKSTDTKWAQLLLSTCDIVLFLDERINFCYPDGRQSTGKWSPYMFCGYGQRSSKAIVRASRVHEYRGVLMRRP